MPVQRLSAALALAAALLLVPAAGAAAAGEPFCRPGEVPRFRFGLAALAEQLGETMGQPVECEHADSASGDTLQRTSTGLAFYTRATNTPTFTDGYRHWALTPDGLAVAELPGEPLRPLQPAPPEPAAPPAAAWVRSIRCPILYAHEVPSPAALRDLLLVLLGAGFRPATLAAVEAAMTGRAEVPNGCLVLTLDDGLYSQFLHGLPVLAELGLPATFFVLPGFADGIHRYMGDDELRALRTAGHEVMGHTCHHPDLPALAAQDQSAFFAELAGCKQLLEAIVGAAVPYLAYPMGAFDATVSAAVEQAGYRAAFTTRPSALLPAETPFALPRIRVVIGESPAEVVRRIRAAGG